MPKKAVGVEGEFELTYIPNVLKGKSGNQTRETHNADFSINHTIRSISITGYRILHLGISVM